MLTSENHVNLGSFGLSGKVVPYLKLPPEICHFFAQLLKA